MFYVFVNEFLLRIDGFYYYKFLRFEVYDYVVKFCFEMKFFI